MAAGTSEFGFCGQRQLLGYDEHVVEIFGPPVLLAAIVARICVQFLGELLVEFDGRDRDGWDVREIEQVAEHYVFDRPGIFGHDVYHKADLLEYPAGQSCGDRESQAIIGATSTDS
jgi:hypothetical protein